MDAITMEAGSSPIYCAARSEAQRICTWHSQSNRHVVCRLDRRGDRVAPRESYLDNDKMQTYPRQKRHVRRQKRRVRNKELQAQAVEELEQAEESLSGVIDLVGAGPVWCGSEAENLICGWHAIRRTPGYITLSRVSDAPDQKLGMICRFTAAGDRTTRGCVVEISGVPPLNYYSPVVGLEPPAE
jgi:hypothetical protein